MDFKTEAQKVCYQNVSKWLTEIFGEFVLENKEKPSFAIQRGSALVEIWIFPWREDDSMVGVRSWVVTDADLQPDLLEYLLRENNNFLFGAFGISEDNVIFFQHSIVGSTCDKPELKTSVLAVAEVADDYDDKIVSRWGGQTARDRYTAT